MPLSPEALAGLRAAVEWNPHGARELLAILKEYSAWVKYKNDPYGPLGLILFGVMRRQQIGNGISMPVRSKSFPEDKLNACKNFGDEWKQRQFTKKELADTLEILLAERNTRF